MLPEIALDVVGRPGKVDQNVALVFVFRELLNDCGLPDSARALNQQRFLSSRFVLPCEEFVIYLSLEKHGCITSETIIQQKSKKRKII